MCVYCEIGPFPLILIGSNFWKGLREFIAFMASEGVFTQEEIGFSRIVDSPKEAVDMVLKSLPKELKKELSPIPKKVSKTQKKKSK